MGPINIHQAKSTLSKLIAQVEADGETIALARAGKPVAQIVPMPARPKKLVPGMLKGQIWMADDFDTTTDAEAALFGIKGGI